MKPQLIQRDTGLVSLSKDRINKLETQILEQESYSRRDNHIFYGVDEPVLSPEDTFHIIQQILVDKLHIKDTRTRIKLVRAHRVGKKPVTGRLAKPILVCFMHYLDAVEQDSPLETRKQATVYFYTCQCIM